MHIDCLQMEHERVHKRILDLLLSISFHNSIDRHDTQRKQNLLCFCALSHTHSPLAFTSNISFDICSGTAHTHTINSTRGLIHGVVVVVVCSSCSSFVSFLRRLCCRFCHFFPFAFDFNCCCRCWLLILFAHLTSECSEKQNARMEKNNNNWTE